MRSFFYKKVSSSELSTDKYIGVNNFGYYEDIMDARIYRERGRSDYQLIYIKNGELLVGRGAEVRALSDGNICLFRPNEAQIYNVNGIKTTYFWIHFSGKEADAMLSSFKERAYNIGAFPEFEYYCHGPVEEFSEMPELAERLCEGRLIALIAKITQRINTDKAKEKNMAIIRPALSAIYSGEHTVYTNESLARLCGLSKSYFMKIFKDIMGMSPQQYHTALVINKSRYLLSTSSYNISEIAHLCGINDGLYFSRMFKKHVGLSPREYRQQGYNFI